MGLGLCFDNKFIIQLGVIDAVGLFVLNIQLYPVFARSGETVHYLFTVHFGTITEIQNVSGEAVNLWIAFILELKAVFFFSQAVAIIKLGSLGAEAVDVIRAFPVGGKVTRLKGMIGDQRKIFIF